KGDGKQTPVVDDVDVAYQMPNVAPQIKSIKIAPAVAKGDALLTADSGKSQEHHVQTIAWEASDPNGDALRYSIYFRSSSLAPWILLKDKLSEATYDWDTRSVSDGRYEIKVIASDEA